MKRSISFRPTLLALVLATNFPVAHAAVPKDMLVIGKAADYSAAIFLIPICISFDTAEKRRYATYLILNRRFSFAF
ncbi:hypothetical protein BG826_RS13255 [Escherichia coli]|nr:hypothetical protein [Escherichia coli]EFF3576834.1 hypothetical protein [Escherichia coli]EFG4272455.1 hypothetical protein [Escherichia coli]EFI6591704.1 hypothetical protein [Escherichia coli]